MSPGRNDNKGTGVCAISDTQVSWGWLLALYLLGGAGVGLLSLVLRLLAVFPSEPDDQVTAHIPRHVDLIDMILPAACWRLPRRWFPRLGCIRIYRGTAVDPRLLG